MSKYFGYNAPFLSGSLRVLRRQEDDRLIRNDLLQLLLTGPNERVMRPDWGSPIRPFLFSQMDERAKTDLEIGIRAAVETYERRVTLTTVDIEFSDDGLVNIKLYGYFNYDRMNAGGGALGQADLLVELNVNTVKTNLQV